MKDESVQLNATQSIREGSGSLQSYAFWSQRCPQQRNVSRTLVRTSGLVAHKCLPTFSASRSVRQWMGLNWRHGGDEIHGQWSIDSKKRSWPLLFLWQWKFTMITHIFGCIFYTCPHCSCTLTSKTCMQGLLTPADVYIMCVDTSPGNSRSKNSESPEWRHFREQLNLERCFFRG